jgi:hypothetical protein
VVGLGRDPIAALEGIADNAARRSRTGNRHQVSMLPTVKELGELPLRNPRLDSHQARARVEFQNPVKSGKIQNHAVVSRR